jgi:hypothetical protein
MKKLLWIVLILSLFIGVNVNAAPKSPPYVVGSSDCSWLTFYGVICQDTDDGKVYVWNGATQVELAASAGAGDITDVWNCSTGDCAVIVAGAADALNATAAAYMIPWPILADCSAVVAEGRACWDSATDILYIGDGAAAKATGAGGAGDITSVGDCTSGACLEGTATANGTYIRLRDSNDSHYLQLGVGDLAANRTLLFPITAAVAGDIVVGSAANTLSYLAVGASGQIVTTNGTVPAWSAYTVAAPGAANGILASDGTNWTRVTTFVGAVTGNASTATSLSDGDKGDFTVTTGTHTIDTGAVTVGKLATSMTIGATSVWDYSAITHSNTNVKGLLIPSCGTSSNPTSGANYICWDTSAQSFKVYDSGWKSFATVAAPLDSPYWVSTTDGVLSAEVNMGALTTGMLYNTVTAGVAVPSTATDGTHYLSPAYIVDTAYGAGWHTDTTHAPSKNAVYDEFELRATKLNAAFSGTFTFPTGFTGIIRADSGVLSVDADVTAEVAAGSTAAAGKVQLATNAQTLTGTSTSLVTTVDDVTYRFSVPPALGSTTPASVTATTFWAGGITSSTTCDSTITSGFCIDADGDTFLKSASVAKTTSVAGRSLLYSSYLTEKNGVGWQGPSSASGMTTYYLAFPEAAPTAGQVMLAGTPAGTPLVSTMTWGLPAGLNITSQAQGDVLYFNGTAWVRLAPGTADYFLQTKGAGANPVWAVPSAGSVALDDVTNPDAAKTITLLDNDASALSFGATGKADILKIITTDNSEGVTMSGTLGVTGAVTGASFNGNTITTGTGTLTLGAGSSLVTSATNSITLTSAGATNVTLPTSGTLAILGANAFTGAQTFTGSGTLTSPPITTAITPISAGGATLGTTALEWGNAYFTDSAVIYGQANQSATLTSSASLWTANNFASTGTLAAGGGAFTVDADGDVVAKSLKISKVNGVASTSLLYEATTTEENGVGWKGPASRASDLYLQFSNDDPAANQFLLFPAPTTGTSTGVWTTYGQFGALNLITTGTVKGKISVIPQTADANVTNAEMLGTWITVDGAHTMTFTEEGTVGLSVCFKATTAAALVIHPHANDSIVFTDGVDHGHDTLTSPAVAGSYACLIMDEANHWQVAGTRGTWTTP